MTDRDDAETSPSSRRLRWVAGWVVIPAILVAALFLSGLHVGARHPDMWLSRAMLWLFG